MNLIVRADDMGYSEAYNLGYLEAIRNGIVTCAELMVDMPGAEQAACMLQEFPWIPVGIHLHLCGRPCADPKLIPTLIGEDGFLNVKYTRNAGKDFSLDELYIEGKAQIERFIKLMGRKPDVISNASDADTTYYEAFRILIEEYKINYLKAHVYYKWIETNDGFTVKAYPVKPLISGREGKEWGTINDQFINYKPENIFLEYNEAAYDDDDYYYTVFHPGYLDGFIMNNSRLTVGRCKDVDACTSVVVKTKLREKNVKLITCNDLMFGTNDYQNFMNTRNLK